MAQADGHGSGIFSIMAASKRGAVVHRRRRLIGGDDGKAGGIGMIGAALAQAIGEGAYMGIASPDHRQPVRANCRQRPRLGCNIAGHPAMPVKMVRGDIQQHRNIRAQRGGCFQLIG